LSVASRRKTDARLERVPDAKAVSLTVAMAAQATALKYLE
jgi:hypothetical protein